MSHLLGRRLILGLACASLVAFSACGTSEPAPTIDLTSPIKDPATPTQNKVQTAPRPR